VTTNASAVAFPQDAQLAAAVSCAVDMIEWLQLQSRALDRHSLQSSIETYASLKKSAHAGFQAIGVCHLMTPG